MSVTFRKVGRTVGRVTRESTEGKRRGACLQYSTHLLHDGLSSKKQMIRRLVNDNERFIKDER